jgi:phage/plasmid-like protein (TIGR03299 family)
MAHNLAKKENGEYAYVGAHTPAWHKLGATLANAFDAKTALEQGGLNFNVIKLPKHYNAPTTKNDSIEITAPDSYFLLREDRVRNVDGSGILGECGKNYHIVQNEDLFSTFDFLVEKDALIYETAGVLGNGERVWIMAKLPNDIVVGPGKKDLIESYVLITNAHTGKHSANVLITPVRVVCANTLTAALTGSKNIITIRHFKNATQKLQEAHKALNFSTKYYSELKKKFNEMYLHKITDKQLLNYIYKTLKVKDPEEIATKKQNQVNAILDLVESGSGAELTRGTLWGAYQGVTEYADHYKVIRNSQNDNGVKNSKVLDSIWFGESAKLKQTAFTLAQSVLFGKDKLN